MVRKTANSNRAPSAHPYANLLQNVQKPARYLGGEEQAIIKPASSDLSCRFVLAFPDIYEIGMSHLGTRILYDLINKHEDLSCERCFSPWFDMEEQLRTHKLPLISLETQTPLCEFDVVGVSLQYELCYTNVLLNLDLGGIPLRSSERSTCHPIVIAGGPTATHPEPLADFVDIFLVGEAEEILPDLLRTIGSMRRSGKSRKEILCKAASFDGLYLPHYYRVQEQESTGIQAVVGRSPEGEEISVPLNIQRIFVRDLDKFPFPTRFPVPYAQAIFDRASVEITRGCTEGCRFCQAGIIYRPVRERKPKDIIKAVLDGTDASGFDEASLTALSTADVSCIDPLIKELVPELRKRKVSLGISSLRAYGLNEELLDEIKKVGIEGLTFAPEAGTQRMRNVINKNVSEEDILLSARRIFSRGYDRMKMYFIMGLPTETEEDVLGIVEIGQKVWDIAVDRFQGKKHPKITVSVSQHVPKPHTPFQWAAMDSMLDLETKVQLLHQKIRKSGLVLKTHSVRESWLECILARGDRKLGAVIEEAYRSGSRFDGWRECFRFNSWLDAFEKHKIDPSVYTRTLPVEATLPWSHIDIGLEADFLQTEYRKALRSRLSPPCGKPAGAQVHHQRLEGEGGALNEKRRLVCYDCGIACDLSDMRDERIAALRSLSKITANRQQREIEEQQVVDHSPKPSTIIPPSKLLRRLPTSQLADEHVRKKNAEAPFSRVRIFFRKIGTAAFLGHLDLIRLLPRMMRRCGLELAYTRGFRALPRMIFGPALGMGMRGLEEVVECDLILPISAEDMNDKLDEKQRKLQSQSLFDRISPVSPPGIEILSVRIIRPDEIKLSHLVDGAIYSVDLNAKEFECALAGLENRSVLEEMVIERRPSKKKKAPKRRKSIDNSNLPRKIRVGDWLFDIYLDHDNSRLYFSIATHPHLPSLRPRELITCLFGRSSIPDFRISRVTLLARNEQNSRVALRNLDPVYDKHAKSTQSTLGSIHHGTY